MRRSSVTAIRFFGSFLLALALGLVLVPTAFADEDEATRKYLKAVEDYEAGKYEDALEGFEEAFSASESPNAQLYIARCLVSLGRNAEGYRAMAATVALAREKAQTESRYAQTRDAAAAELVVLEPKVAKLVVALSEEVPEANITINGETLPPESWGKPYAIEPGTITVEATAPNYVASEKTLSIDAGDTETVALTLERDLPGDDDDGGGGIDIGPLRGAGIGVAVLGVGGLVAFAVAGSAAEGKFDEVSEACGGVTCTDDSQNDTIDEGKTLQTVANVTLGVGLGLAAGGALMIIFGGTEDEPTEEDTISFSAGPTLGGGYAQLEFLF